EYDALSDVTHDRHKEVLQAFQDKGYCLPGKLRKIQHPECPMLPYHMKSRIQQLILQIVQRCNLFCEYCSYSGRYSQRTHANLDMSLETAYKSIDFLMKHSTDLESVYISFYGGEPLLALETIKCCVEYIKREYPERKVQYNTTTNGTLFTEEAVSFLQAEKFIVMISLDGPAFVHDKHRKFLDGQGSFDTVMQSVEYIKENFPELYKNISFNAVISPENDYKCVKDFFDAETVLQDSMLRSVPVNDLGSKVAVEYDDNYFVTSRREIMKVLLCALGFISPKSVSKLFISGFSNIQTFRKSIDAYMPLPETAHHSGPCLPGVLRLFVDVNGDFYPCERVSETSEAMRIGHIDTGFDIGKAEKLLSIGELTEEECLNCWNLRFCGLCAAFAEKDGKLDKLTKLSSCSMMINDSEYKLRVLCLFREMDVRLEEVSLL
ncbi:MAG: Cys-rich peptide radical SAM maturase CcpM, partial [Firmicutes bacterium]|nr:Cys-rich peptide radical SAM maturase CcpM [Bacillota bacterium]